MTNLYFTWENVATGEVLGDSPDFDTALNIADMLAKNPLTDGERIDAQIRELPSATIVRIVRTDGSVESPAEPTNAQPERAPETTADPQSEPPDPDAAARDLLKESIGLPEDSDTRTYFVAISGGNDPVGWYKDQDAAHAKADESGGRVIDSINLTVL